MGILSWTEDYGEEMFMNYNMSRLKRDEAYLSVTASSKMYLYSVYKECIRCPFLEEKTIASNTTFKIGTSFAKLWRVLDHNVTTSPINSNRSVLCELDPMFEEFGVYSLDITSNSCHLQTLKEPVNIYFPILTILLVYTALLIFATSCFCVWRVYTIRLERETACTEYDLDKYQDCKRVRALDTFRGISIVFMIFVNFGSGGYEILNHAVWNGLHLADLPFPWFMWIMGVCIPISTSSIMKKGISKKVAFKNVLRRSCILFALGIFLASGKGLDNLRIFGVLQRFGICYLVVASTFILAFTGFQHDYERKKKIWNLFTDIFAMKYQWCLGIVVLLAHNLLTFMLSFRNCPGGYLGPGGYHENGRYFDCTGGAAGYIDEVILGNHRYQRPTIIEIYRSGFFDPEGILGCLTSILQVIIGAQAGTILLAYKQHNGRVIRWVIWGLLLGIIGGVLCGFSKEDGVIPINKNLWSLSYVMVTSCFAFLLLAACYFLIDVKQYWTGKPFLFAGMNSILMYVGHSLTNSCFPIHWVVTSSVGLNTHFLSLMENVWATGMWILIAYYLYTIKFFLSI